MGYPKVYNAVRVIIMTYKEMKTAAQEAGLVVKEKPHEDSGPGSWTGREGKASAVKQWQDQR